VKKNAKAKDKAEKGKKNKTKEKGKEKVKGKKDAAPKKAKVAKREKSPSESSSESYSYYSSAEEADEQQQLMSAMMLQAQQQQQLMMQGAMLQPAQMAQQPNSQYASQYPGYAPYGAGYDAYGRPVAPPGYPAAHPAAPASNAYQLSYEAEQERKEQARRRAEDEQRQRQEDIKKKAEKERAVAAIRLAIANLQQASAEKLQALMKVLDDVVGKEIQHVDEKTETLRIEIEKAVNESNSRVALTKDLRSIIKAGEDQLKATADLIRQAVQNPDSALLERLEAAGIEAQARSAELQSFAEKKAKGIAQLLVNAKGPGLLEIKTMSSKLTKLSSDLKQVSTNGEGIVREGKERLERKSLSAAATQQIKEVFEKYDADSDGFLSRKEVTKYSKGQFKFNPPADCLDRIWRNLVEGTKGISLQQFQQLKVAIGTARVLAREEAKTAEKTADT